MIENDLVGWHCGCWERAIDEMKLTRLDDAR
jgi:hypothetical protein